MPGITKALNAVSVLSLLLIGAGCTLTQPFPMAARPGDTVTLGVGEADGMTVTNTTVNFIPTATPSTATPSPINLTSNIRAVFNLYADKRSAFYDLTTVPNVGFIDTASGHEPWETVVVLDLPTTMPVGTGTLQVQTSASFPAGGDGLIPNVGVVPIAFDVLPGQGSSNAFNYAYGAAPGFATSASNLAWFQPESHYEVRPPLAAGSLGKVFGAISLTFNHAMVLSATSISNGGTAVTGDYVRIITQDLPDTYSQLQCSWSANATQLTVNLVSASDMGMRLAESRISIVPMGAQFTGQPTLTAVSYYDMNGNAVTGPAVSTFTISNN